MATYFEHAEELYKLNQGKLVFTDDYEGFVSGFHYAVDDNDSCDIIVTITKNKSSNYCGYSYMLRGDVHVVHPGNKRYDLIREWDLPKYGLKNNN